MPRTIILVPAAVVVLLAIAFYVLAFWPLRDTHPRVVPATGLLAVRDATIYTSPDEPPLGHATLLLHDGRIAALGLDVAVPADAQMLPCHGCVITAGFWNMHVHFTEARWRLAEWQSASALEAGLKNMLTSRGFTTVVDTGSNLRDTVPLRRRIERGELLGPKIYTAGAAQYPPNGIPYYLRNTLPSWQLHFMPQPASPDEAARVAERNIAEGADLLKLFTGSYVARGTILPMPEQNAEAAVEVAHQHGQLAFCHPSNLAGVMVALHSGVDVLAHAPDDTEGIDTRVLQSLVERHVAMIPTLKMFAVTVTTKPAYLDPIYAEVRSFHELGGELLFGTDVGYMTDYSTEGEYQGLQASGLGAMDMLRMLTLAPATRFGVAPDRGTLAVGRAADFVILDADPAADVTAFAKVAATVRDGRVIYRKQ